MEYIIPFFSWSWSSVKWFISSVSQCEYKLMLMSCERGGCSSFRNWQMLLLHCCSFLQFVNNVRKAGPIFFYTVPIITENITLISYLNASTARLLSGEIYLAVAWSEATPCSALTHEPVLSKGITSRKSYWICTEQVFQVQSKYSNEVAFLSNEVTILSLLWFKAQQPNYHMHNTSFVWYIKSWKRCTKLKYIYLHSHFNGKYPFCIRRSQKQKTQTDPSQTRIQSMWRKYNQANWSIILGSSVRQSSRHWIEWQRLVLCNGSCL